MAASESNVRRRPRGSRIARRAAIRAAPHVDSLGDAHSQHSGARPKTDHADLGAFPAARGPRPPARSGRPGHRHPRRTGLLADIGSTSPVSTALGCDVIRQRRPGWVQASHRNNLHVLSPACGCADWGYLPNPVLLIDASICPDATRGDGSGGMTTTRLVCYRFWGDDPE